MYLCLLVAAVAPKPLRESTSSFRVKNIQVVSSPGLFPLASSWSTKGGPSHSPSQCVGQSTAHRCLAGGSRVLKRSALAISATLGTQWPWHLKGDQQQRHGGPIPKANEVLPSLGLLPGGFFCIFDRPQRQKAALGTGKTRLGTIEVNPALFTATPRSDQIGFWV